MIKIYRFRPQLLIENIDVNICNLVGSNFAS